MVGIAILISILMVVSLVVAELSVPTFIVFLILKLCNVIAWGWFWVFFPLIVGAAMLIIWLVLGVLAEFAGD